MKISAEVREFARLNPSLPEEEGASPAISEERRLAESDAEAGMARMSRRFHEEGSEFYLPAAE